MTCALNSVHTRTYSYSSPEQKEHHHRMQQFAVLDALDLAARASMEARIVNCMQRSPMLCMTKNECHQRIVAIVREAHDLGTSGIDWQSYIVLRCKELAPFVIKEKKGSNARAIFQMAFKEERYKTVYTLLLYQGCDLAKPYLFTLGNVDILLISQGHKQKEEGIIYSSNFSLLSPESILDAARFLDRGQRLNLSELVEHGVQIEDIVKKTSHRDPYYQYFAQVLQNYQKAPNGSLLLKKFESSFSVVHQSAYKEVIESSKNLKMSRAGCIGPLVYTTELVGPSGRELGGHTIGLLERKGIAEENQKKNLIYMEVEKTGNFFTNWIDKTGRGAIFLSARRDVLFPSAENEDLRCNDLASAQALDQYKALYPIFLLVRLYATCHEEKDIGVFFDKIIAVIEGIAKKQRTILNGVFFEVLKDYILLFQKDERSYSFLKKGSFNMANQYEIFFTLDPKLRKKWDTGAFPVCMKDVMQVFRDFSLIASEKEELDFKEFFLNLLSYYLLFGCLEGAQQIKDPESLTHYDELIRYHPNLSGLIFSSCLKQYFKETDLAGQFFEKTVEGYKKFYNGRKIDCVIKAGFARTEEIGVRDTAKVRFFDFYFQDQQGPSKIHKLEEIQGMQIAGISTTTGFTQRLGGVLRQNSSE